MCDDHLVIQPQPLYFLIHQWLWFAFYICWFWMEKSLMCVVCVPLSTQTGFRTYSEPEITPEICVKVSVLSHRMLPIPVSVMCEGERGVEQLPERSE